MAVDDSHTKILLHCNGSNGSQTITDESGKAWTANGNAQIVTAQSKFGGSCLYFDGSGDYIDTPDSDDFTVGAGDFTVDFWMRPYANNLDSYIFMQGENGNDFSKKSIGMFIRTDGRLGIYASVGSTVYEAVADVNYAASTWYHVAGERYGSNLNLYLNGTKVATSSEIGTSSVNNSSYKMTIGRFGEYSTAYWYYKGWLQEFRFSDNARYQGNDFTPPTAAYAPPSSGFIPRVIMF